MKIIDRILYIIFALLMFGLTLENFWVWQYKINTANSPEVIGGIFLAIVYLIFGIGLLKNNSWEIWSVRFIILTYILVWISPMIVGNGMFVSLTFLMPGALLVIISSIIGLIIAISEKFKK